MFSGRVVLGGISHLGRKPGQPVEFKPAPLEIVGHHVDSPNWSVGFDGALDREAEIRGEVDGELLRVGHRVVVAASHVEGQ